jgi:hypothetical protein
MMSINGKHHLKLTLSKLVLSAITQNSHKARDYENNKEDSQDDSHCTHLPGSCCIDKPGFRANRRMDSDRKHVWGAARSYRDTVTRRKSADQ